ncbi:hypothetical protein [Bacillus sp. NTK034]|uniref:hypothetical protein n=1 Tax=Bacillus sp. NTK034 TaxID=2802176 RepID=UPI001A8C3F21|nr:hypothetical protein [Bacillus sp. NTK034]MBN8200500.1 hypothetical protein [Bacillus sp. NTK034]
MDLRTAYKLVIKHELEILETEGRWQFAKGQIEELTERLHDDYEFTQTLQEAIEEHLEDFGENYDLF